MYILRRSAQDLKNVFFALMSTLWNFNLNIESIWADKVVKSILETWHVNYVIVHVRFIYFQIKRTKNMQCKQELF